MASKVETSLGAVRATGVKGEMTILSPKPEDLVPWLELAGVPTPRAKECAAQACKAKESPGSIGPAAGVVLSWQTVNRRRLYTVAWERAAGERVPK